MPRTPPKIPRPTPAPRVPSPAVARVAAAVRASAHPASVVDEFWRGLAATPLVETGEDAGVCTVTFLWRDPRAEEVLLFANRLTDERTIEASLLERVPGTDLWWLAYRMDADWRASYSFIVRRPGERAPWRTGDDQIALRAALDRGRPDPRNPATVRNRAGVVQSVVSLPQAPPQPWLRALASQPAQLETLGLDGRTVWMYAPAGTRDDEPLPLVVVLDGEVWHGVQGLPAMVDAMIAAGALPPVRLVLVDSGGVAQRWQEMDAAGDAAAWIADCLIPWVRARYAVPVPANAVTVAGQSLGGYTALRAVLDHPDRVGGAIAQSASTWMSDLGALAGERSRAGVRVHLQVGRQEWVLRDGHHTLADALRRAGADVDFVEYNGGHDYACWRGGLTDALAALLAPAGSEPNSPLAPDV